jgi:hypothetical protein
LFSFFGVSLILVLNHEAALLINDPIFVTVFVLLLFALYVQQGLEIRGLEECGPWRYTVLNWFPKH